MKISPDPDFRTRCRHRSGDPDCDCLPECPDCGASYSPSEGHDCLDDVPADELLDIAKELRDERDSLRSSPAPDGQPILAEAFADNGAHSHWYLIDAKTGSKIWSEAPDECAARGFAVSPAPVVGGVPEMSSEELCCLLERLIYPSEDIDARKSVANINRWFASRLPALKPGEVDALDALRAIWPFVEEDDGGFATKQYQAAIDKVRAVIQAQATTTEKETDYV